MSTININVSKADMGLSNVDNTSDLNKPISTATQTALDNKVDKVVGTTNRLTKWSSSSAIGVSLIQDNGTTLSIGTTPVANNLIKVSSNSTDVTLVGENSQATGVGISGSSSGANGVGGSFTSTSVTGVKIGVNASATGAGGTNKGAVFGATGGATNYSIQLTDGTEGSGKFLKSVTANGEANWVSIANTDVSGLGSLATQSGTFSGTSSGTNTGDQIISDATITTTDITTNNFTTAKHGFVPKGTNVGNFLKDDGTWGAISAGGLSFFTEAQATASPNNLVYANSLTAVATTTNADFVIQPKGTGAILCSIPNNTATVPNIGGNKRGQYALDLQRFGTSNAQTEVASGNYSAIIGGFRNTASGTSDSVVNGFRNTVSGGYSTILNGQLNTASGLYSFIGVGQNNTASSTYSMVIGGFGNSSTNSYAISGGDSCTASGTRAVALGTTNTASGDYSSSLNSTNTASSSYSNARGLSANTGTTWGKYAIGGGGATLGSSQKGLLVQTTRTTGNTPTEIAFQGGGVDLRAQMTCADNMGMRVKGSVIGKQSGSVNISAWDFDYVIVRGVGVGTTSVVVSNVNVVTNVPAWGTPTITADTARGYASLKVIGAAATNIQWTATIESTEVIYA